MQLTNAGMLTDCMVASWELDDMKAVGRLGDAYGTESEGQRIFGELVAANGPVTPVSSGIYRVIPRENRRFRAHITLARDRRGMPRSKKPQVGDVEAAMSVGEFVLMQSKLSNKGSEYSVLQRVML